MEVGIEHGFPIGFAEGVGVKSLRGLHAPQSGAVGHGNGAPLFVHLNHGVDGGQDNIHSRVRLQGLAHFADDAQTYRRAHRIVEDEMDVGSFIGTKGSQGGVVAFRSPDEPMAQSGVRISLHHTAHFVEPLRVGDNRNFIDFGTGFKGRDTVFEHRFSGQSEELFGTVGTQSAAHAARQEHGNVLLHFVNSGRWELARMEQARALYILGKVTTFDRHRPPFLLFFAHTA